MLEAKNRARVNAARRENGVRHKESGIIQNRGKGDLNIRSCPFSTIVHMVQNALVLAMRPSINGRLKVICVTVRGPAPASRWAKNIPATASVPVDCWRSRSDDASAAAGRPTHFLNDNLP